MIFAHLGSLILAEKRKCLVLSQHVHKSLQDWDLILDMTRMRITNNKRNEMTKEKIYSNKVRQLLRFGTCSHQWLCYMYKDVFYFICEVPLFSYYSFSPEPCKGGKNHNLKMV